MRKASIAKKIMILVAILALPGFLYYLLTAKGKNRYKPLPFYGPKQVAATGHKFHGKYIPDTIYHKLSDFKLTDQNGKEVSFKNFDKKIFIANFFYTGCPTVCSAVNKNVSELVYAYRKNPMVYFLTITVNPDKDKPEVLKQYSRQFETTNKWLFLTGDTTTVYNLARKGFLVDALKVPGKDEFIYSDKLILIDAEKRIRGYYNGASTADITKLNDEIKVQIAEELRKVDKALY
ncbi:MULTISPECIES: SCO family protein [unclassified Mucilaginibacter]|uniref:SCO family protein n=1 Tax=unclassified Mucilaginibacter TaxID=2617802 RepID=UPI000960AD02|nr:MULTISPECIES: SCO family protein [unclassified Mucilaginibacter]OJW12529.1 MAG: electron transport protein SCO1/SenC [Mucilaginibacter sp. 44-25]PLW88825.1 MAG: SCO family protein [Mucilaginibacter sp.]HEK21913.1 SCO family protein [Bacteroidota bacterium]